MIALRINLMNNISVVTIFLARVVVSKERFAKVSSNTPHVDLKFTLRSLTQVTVLHFVLRLTFYQAHDFFKMSSKKSSISHPATVFLFCNLSSTRNLTKPHCFGEENEKISWGHSPRTPFFLQTPHKHPHQLRHWAFCVFVDPPTRLESLIAGVSNFPIIRNIRKTARLVTAGGGGGVSVTDGRKVCIGRKLAV